METKLNIATKSLVSIIVPVYNLASYLPRCIESILMQTYINLQIIIINDGSTDNSYDVIKFYEKNDSRIIVLNQENSGVSVARNQALEKIKGDYVMFVDGDDWIDIGSVEYLLRLITSYNAEIACCSFVYEETISGRKRKSEPSFKPFLLKGSDILNKYLTGKNMWASVCARLYKTSFLKEQNIKFEPGIKIGEDGYFSLQIMSKVSSVVISGKPYYHVLVRPTSATRYSVYESTKDEISVKYETYLRKNGLWNNFESAYKAWYVRSGSSNLFRLALKTNYLDYKKYHQKYIEESNYLKYNTISTRFKMNFRNHIISLLGKNSILSYYAIFIVNLVRGKILV